MADDRVAVGRACEETPTNLCVYAHYAGDATGGPPIGGGMRLNRYMPNLDTEKLPTGKRGWAAFVAALEASDDRVERHYLELKTEADLTAKRDLRKVVKFILGAAHRDPAKAARHFGSHAVMVLGLSNGGVRGLTKFEVMDLEREIQKFAGVDAPGWDIELVPAEDERDIVIIIADPPTGRIWPVLADGDPLRSGDVYLRADGATRHATGPELAVMIARTHASGRVLDVAVEPFGQAHAFAIDVPELTAFVERMTEKFKAQLQPLSEPIFANLGSTFTSDRRSEERFLRDVEEWSANSLENPARGVYLLAAQLSGGSGFRLVNKTTTSLKDVRLELAFGEGIVALDWEEQEDVVTLFPDRPVDWGKDSWALGLQSVPRFDPTVFPVSGVRLHIEKQEPAQLVVELGRLHAEQTVNTNEDDLVLVLFGEDPAELPETIEVHWRLTAGDVDEVLTGRFDMDVLRGDWRDPLRSFIGGLKEQATT